MQFDKRNDTDCIGSDNGNPANDEIAYSVTGPDSTVVTLVSAGTYSSNSNPASVTVTFSDGGTALGTLPTTGTFDPTGSLADFNGKSPFGSWTVTAQDTASGKVLCHTDASVTITTIAGPVVTLSASPSTISEAAASSTITATLDMISAQNVTVNLGLTGTATGGGTDYSLSSSSIVINAGLLMGTTTLTSVDDSLLEIDETAIIDISSVTNATEDGAQQQTVTITDNDTATASLSVDTNGNETGPTNIVYSVTLSKTNNTGSAITFNITPSGGNAVAGTDYSDFTGSMISVANGSSSGTFAVTVNNDTINEATETVNATISNSSNPFVTIDTATAIADILDNDAAPTVTLGVDNATIIENAGVATFTATLSAVSGQNVTVNLGLTGTATGSGTDYSSSASSITINAGLTTGSITVTSNDDTIDEADETAIVDITSVTNGTEDGTQQATTSITDDDAAPTVTLSVDNATIIENAGVATFTATLSAVSGQDVTVNLGLTGTATGSGTDYSSSASSITINAGLTTGSITVTSNDDVIDEADETAIVDITSVTNGTEDGTQQATTSITDDDAAPTVTLSVDNATIIENAGVATFTATLSAVSGQDVTVNLGLTGTATGSGTDYSSSASSITINAGLTTGSITVTSNDDVINEADETAIVDITSVTNGTEDGTQQATTSITDDDAAPTVTLSVDNATIIENAGVATFTATLSAASGQNVTVNLGLTGTATGSGTDYSSSASSITINAGLTTGSITVTSNDDVIDEADETVIVDIASVTNGTEDGTQQATTSITDDDAAPTVTLSVDNATIIENAGVATFTATLSAASGQNVTVNLGLTGTATGSGTDYSSSASSITINAGLTTGSITVTSNDDTIDEADETAIVDITSVTNGTEDGTQQATTSITDDDAAPTVTLGVDNATIIENAGVATFTATLSAASGQNVTVNLGLTGTATGSGTDYSSSASSITINAGLTTGSITVTSNDDTIDEADETAIVDITSVTNGTEDGIQQATTTITDDDAAPTVTLGVDNATIIENAGVATFTATLSAVSGQNVTVNLGLTGTATGSGTDYSSSASSITINAGLTTGSITVTSNDDVIDEADETAIVDITSVTNGTEDGTQQATTTITDDDAAPTVTLGVDNATIIENAGVATFTATLSAVSGQNVTVNLGLTGTATGSGTDYSSSASSITINAGLTTGSITVTSVNDLIDETNETVIVDITSVTNGTESGTQQATTSIIDDDAAIDTDGDGLTDDQENNTYNTDPNVADTDNDDINDGQEVSDGSAPLDRGSNIPVLPTTICSLWNGFLQNPGLAMWNIMEHVNLSNAPITVSSTLYSISGAAQSTTQFVVAPGAQYDLIVHDMNGWTLNSYGQVCSTVIGGNPGDMDGRMVFYKPTNTGRFEFAYALAFSGGIKGPQFVPFNTFQPSLDSTDASNFVANWIQITNMENSAKLGTLYFYQQDGAILGQTNVNLAARARQDFPAHQFGSSIVGLVEFRPSDSSAKFGVQNVRYYHDSASFVNSFDGSFALDGSVGNGQGITVPLDTIGSTSVLEVANTKNSSLPVRVRVYDLSGAQKLNLNFTLTAYASVHLILDSVLVSERGTAYITVTGNIVDSVIATAMQYDYTPSNGIQTLYGIPAKQALGSTLRGTYNTFINQNCTLFITNPTSTIQNANIMMTRLDGTTVVSGQAVAVPANGGFLYDACSQDIDNTYGVITTTPNTANTLYTTVIRQDNLDDYRFPTLSRAVS